LVDLFERKFSLKSVQC